MGNSLVIVRDVFAAFQPTNGHLYFGTIATIVANVGSVLHHGTLGTRHASTLNNNARRFLVTPFVVNGAFTIRVHTHIDRYSVPVKVCNQVCLGVVSVGGGKKAQGKGPQSKEFGKTEL